MDRDFLGHLKLIPSPQGDKNYEQIEVLFFSVIQTGLVNRVLGHVYLFLLKYGKCVNLKKTYVIKFHLNCGWKQY